MSSTCTIIWEIFCFHGLFIVQNHSTMQELLIPHTSFLVSLFLIMAQAMCGESNIISVTISQISTSVHLPMVGVTRCALT